MSEIDVELKADEKISTLLTSIAEIALSIPEPTNSLSLK